MKDGISTLVSSCFYYAWTLEGFFALVLLASFFSPLLPDTPPLPDVMETRSDSERW